MAESTFNNLAKGDVAVAQYEFAADAENIIGGDVSVMAVIDQEEYYTFNNEASLYVSKPYHPTAIQKVTVTGQNAAGQIFCNEDDIGATACCAFYNDKGRMLKAETASLTPDEQNTMSCTIPDGAATVKWFVMDSDGRPLCASVEKSA